MGRIMVFQTSIVSVLYAYLFVIVTCFLDKHAYAVFGDVATSDKPCICACLYPLRTGSVIAILVPTIAFSFQALGLTFRALKGLRRSGWANLFTILYTIPIEAFPV